MSDVHDGAAQVGLPLGSRLDSASLAYGAALLAEEGGSTEGQSRLEALVGGDRSLALMPDKRLRMRIIRDALDMWQLLLVYGLARCWEALILGSQAASKLSRAAQASGVVTAVRVHDTRADTRKGSHRTQARKRLRVTLQVVG